MSTLSSSCSSLAFSDGSFKRVVNISQRHSGITQLKSIVTQLVPFNTIRPLVSDTSSARVSQCKPTDAWHPRAQNTHLPKAMLHRTKFMRCSAGLLQKRGHVGFLKKNSKMSLLCRAIDPTFQDNREGEEFGFSTSAPLKPLLRQTRC